MIGLVRCVFHSRSTECERVLFGITRRPVNHLKDGSVESFHGKARYPAIAGLNRSERSSKHSKDPGTHHSLGGVRTFHQKSTCLIQLTLEPCVVHIWSVNTLKSRGNETLDLHREDTRELLILNHEDDGQVGAIDLLRKMSFFHSEGIQKDLFQVSLQRSPLGFIETYPRSAWTPCLCD